MARLITQLNELHDRYVESVNLAVAEDDVVRIDRLAADYDRDSRRMVAEHEGRTDLLALFDAETKPASWGRRLADSLRTRLAA